MTTIFKFPMRFKNLFVLMLLSAISIYMSLPQIMRTPDGRVYPDAGCSMMHTE